MTDLIQRIEAAIQAAQDRGEKHHHRCWCSLCDIGVTATPPPPSLWERFKAILRAERKDDHE